ncbi:hypothetical protein SCLCIDRAFT_18296 [Scleroderma citrinum Foug A]|uniref:Uncharacterized protein n=1 Tax=Scleroderma citrinum Foug A TaxID=1036808 RepID=A0A0C3D752_9AGAM|nr:hypothetical protein SCLCIDRAFT_18296 [Scleroderma citrinum Foug A]
MTSLDFIYGLAQPLAAHATLEQQHGVAPISLQTSALLTAASDSNASIYALFGGQALMKYTLTNFRHFMTHLIQYLVVCKVAGLAPGELHDQLDGTTGHSQGLVSAVAIATPSTYESFDTNAKKALHWLFFSGMRGQEAFPVLALELSLVSDSVEGGEGVPVPMLSVNGLELPTLEQDINVTNKHLPSHSQLLENLKGGELWTPDELAIPVFNTEDGPDMCKLTSSITRSLCDQIFTSPIHWDTATGFPETTTLVVDFGLGGVNGIGTLTARNLEGRSVCVIILGNKGRGEVELFDVDDIQYEDWWNKNDGAVHLNMHFSRLLGKPLIMVAGMMPTTVKAGFISAVLSAGYHIEKMAEIQAKIPEGVGITLNSFYINPKQFGFQFPLWQELCREGLPIEGFCVTAGIPSTEKGAEIILKAGLHTAGIKHVSFKPGSVDGIHQVVNIAVANPDFPIILQWTGSRASGYHSYEDFISIRQHDNICLIGGSGFGGVDDLWPYLTGAWLKEKYNMQPMPFDGFLFASHVMVAKEAHTSSSDRGPIHKVTTHAVKLWKEFNDTVFKMPKDKCAAWLAESKVEIIEKLNTDFAKLWLGWKKDETVAHNLGDMTYEEVALRLVRLMYVAHQDRWINVSLRNLTGDWLRHIEECFTDVNGGLKPSILQSFNQLNNPTPFVTKFFNKYSAPAEQLLVAEDRAYFLTILQCPSQKPVPFIPILDASFEVWFKKDSLWAAEDIDAVFDQDPQLKDEPIKDLLGNITLQLIKQLLEHSYGGDADQIPTIDYLAPEPEEFEVPDDILVKKSSTSITYKVGNVLPDVSEWLKVLSGSELNWLKALLTLETIVQAAYIDNPLLCPCAGQHIVVGLEGGSPVSLTFYDAGYRCNTSVLLFLQFKYVPSMGSMPIHEVSEGRNHRIKEFYWKLWFGDWEPLLEISLHETLRVIGNWNEAYKLARMTKVKAPMDFTIVTSWQAIMKAVFLPVINRDLLKLVHLSNGFQLLPGAETLEAGDACIADAHISSVKNMDAGKAVQVKGCVFCDSKPTIKVSSSFLYHDCFSDFENTFETIDEPNYVVELPDAAAVGVINLSKLALLVFHVRSQVIFKDKTSYRDVCVTGDTFLRDQLKRLKKVGYVDFNQEGCQGNPVVTVSTTFTAPLTNGPYSIISGDFNPIHVIPYLSDYTSLPGTITHGMWSSAATRKFVENVVAEGNPAHVIAYAFLCYFIGMVLPGDQLTVKICHIGMRDGNMVVKVETFNEHDEKIIDDNTEVVQPTTVYVFTGQGLQEAGMGMDLYTSSPVACAVWDRADAHLHVDGNVKTLPLFSDIDIRTPKYTFNHPNGLLFATQFAQITLVVMEKAAFEDMQAKGFLGEYSALTSIADVLHISALVDVVFYCGITMQHTVEHDAHNRSNYAMCAINPSCISETFSEMALCKVVDMIATRTSTLLEIVNYNIEGQQYVCAGELVALQTLTNVLIYLKIQKIDIAKLTAKFTVEKVKEMLGDIVMESFNHAKELQKAEGHLKLEHGFATIPLPGIDVPFHSHYLWAGVMPFQAFQKNVN